MDILIQRLKLHFDDCTAPVSVLIWGAGQLGELVASVIEQEWPQHSVQGFIDISVQQAMFKGQRTVYPVDKIASLTFDVLIVSSLEYESEIISQIRKLGQSYLNRTITLSTVPELLPQLELLTEQRNYQALRQLAFLYPDSADIWRALASVLPEGEEKVLCLTCAARLTESSKL